MSLLRLRSHGINKISDELINKDLGFTGDKKNLWYYEMKELGYHYRITDIQCALAISQLRKLDKFISKRLKLVNYYRELIEKVDFLSPAQKTKNSFSSNHIFPVRIKFDELNIKRNDLMIYLRDKSIITQVHYIPIPMHPYYNNKGYQANNFPNNMTYFNEALTLPLFYELEKDQVEYVLTNIKTFFRHI